MTETIRPPITVEGGRRVVIVARCENCNWYSSLPTTTLRMAKDAGLMQDYAQQHEEKFKHLVKFSVK